jgi:prepilin-type N-terminal cleavage/methylation domain-containing protein/prepilin-type processing-associated H-X9-DG protein
MKKSAFTLIELLVVIAIIAVLASIALPVFNKVMERSKATNCANNLRQLGIGLAAYLNDNDDQMFPLTATGGGELVTWPVTMQSKYVSNWKVFRSPFDKVTSLRPDIQQPPNVPVSYGVNVNCFGVNAAKFVAPSQLIVMAPAMTPSKDLIFTGTSDTNPSLMMPAGGGNAKLGTHSGRSQINALYADTHVASLPYRQFAMTEQEEGLKQWWPEGSNTAAQP